MRGPVKASIQFRERAAKNPFMMLGKLEAYSGFPIAQHFQRITEQYGNPERGLKEYQCMGRILFHFQKAFSFAFLAWREALEGEGGAGQTGEYKGSQNGAGTGHKFNGEPCFAAEINGIVPGVTDTGHAAVCA